MNVDLLQYVGSRARCQRIEDAKLFRGWVKTVSETELELTFEGGCELVVGERVAAELQGHQQNCFLIGEVTNTSGTKVEFKLTSGLRLTAPTESVRFQAARFGLFCDLTVDGETYDMEVADLSTGGVGLISPVALPKGKVVNLALHTSSGTAQGMGEIRYCKPMEGGTFRAGVKLHFDERLSKARWIKQFPNAA